MSSFHSSLSSRRISPTCLAEPFLGFTLLPPRWISREFIQEDTTSERDSDLDTSGDAPRKFENSLFGICFEPQYWLDSLSQTSLFCRGILAVNVQVDGTTSVSRMHVFAGQNRRRELTIGELISAALPKLKSRVSGARVESNRIIIAPTCFAILFFSSCSSTSCAFSFSFSRRSTS